MENTPRNPSEEDKAAAARAERHLDDDDDDEEIIEKKPAPRHAPGIAFEKISDEKEKPKPRVSITDRLLERIGAKPEEGENADKPINEVIDDEHEDIEHDKDEGTPSIDADLESADWEAEDAATHTVEPSERASSGEVVPDPDTNPEDFADIPIEADEDDEPLTDDVEPELMDKGLGSEGPPDPPEDEPPVPGDPADEPPDPPSTTTSYYRHGGGGGSSYYSAPGSPWYSAAAADRARQKELEDAEYRGRRAGTRRGLGAGLFFGWLIGRHGKKKQARKFTEELKSKDKEIKSLQSEQDAAALRLDAVQRTQEQLAANIHKEPKQPLKAPQPPIEALKTNSRGERPVKIPERQLVRKVVEVLPLRKTPESLEVAAVAAALTALERTTKKTTLKSETLLAPEDQAITAGTYEVQGGKRVETSAWHRIEIDEKTGRPVENPEVSYGEAFRHERAKEVFREDNATKGDSRRDDQEDEQASKRRPNGLDTGSPAAQLGGLAAASFTRAEDRDHTYDHLNHQDAGLAAGMARTNHTDHLEHRNLLRFAASPIIWGVCVVIVVILFVIGVLR